MSCNLVYLRKNILLCYLSLNTTTSQKFERGTCFDLVEDLKENTKFKETSLNKSLTWQQQTLQN